MSNFQLTFIVTVIVILPARRFALLVLFVQLRLSLMCFFWNRNASKQWC